MDWRVELRAALALQETDRRLDALEAERRGLLADAEVVRLEREVQGRQARLQTLQAELADLERRQRLQELERQSAEAERQRHAQRLYGGAVRSLRDIEGLQKNLEGSAARVSALETAILEAMERCDQIRAAMQQLRDELGGLQGQLQQRRQQLRARLMEVDGLLPRLRAEREQALRALDPQVAREYERIRNARGGVAVAPVADGACQACGMTLSTRLLALVRRGEGPVYCEHCARLLVEAPGRREGGSAETGAVT